MNRHLVVAVLSLAVTACHDETSKSDAGPSDAGQLEQKNHYVCTVDPAQLARGGECLWDDACPCGSYCKAGSCGFDCRADSDCSADKTCDGFGRCVKSVDGGQSVAPPIDDQPRGTLKLSTSLVQLDPLHTLGEVTLTAEGAGVAQAKVLVKDGFEVKCGADAAFSTSCVLPALEPGKPVTLSVRVNEPSVDGAFEATIITSHQTLGFRVRNANKVTQTMAPLEGVYRGYAHPLAFGSMARTVRSSIPAALAEVTIPVEVTVFPEVGNTRVTVLEDSLGVVFPEAKTVGQLVRASSGDLLLRHVARPFIGKGVDGGVSDLDVAVSAESLLVERGLSGLTIKLRSRYPGVLDGANDPYVLWQVALGRVSDLPANTTAPALPQAWTTTDPVAVAAVPLRVETEVRAGLSTALAAVTPATPVELSQAIMCTPYGAPTATRLNTAVTPTSGDFGCTGPNSAQPLTFSVLKETTWQLATQLSACMGDLTATQAVLDGAASVPMSAPCVDGARALAALASAQELDRSRALGNPVAADATASALAHRLLQQWLRTNVFIARQATQVDLLNDILANEQQIGRGFKQTDMLALTGRGYDVLLHPRIAMGLSRMQAQVLLTPDYRPMLAPAATLPSNLRHEQPVALPVALADTLHQTTTVYDALYERARYVTTDRVPLENSARLFLRKSLVLFALASHLADVARANSSTAPRWEGQWQRQAGLYGAGISGLLRSIDNLRRGENPLGIDDKLDLPLYRVGDQSGTIAKFSAVSDYLLGTGTTLDNSAIVPSRVLAAEAALTDARTAWTQNLQQNFTQTELDAEASRRLDAIRRRYGEQVSSLCGDPNMNSATVLDMSVDADDCFVKPVCRATKATRRALLSPGDLARVLCVAATVRERVGANASQVLLTGFNPVQLKPLLEGAVAVLGHTETNGSVVVKLSDGSLVSVAVPVLESTSSASDLGVLSPAALEELEARCAAVAAASENARPETAPSTCTLNGECPADFACVSGACKPSVDTANQTACYQGALGEAAVAIRGAVKDVEIARSELAELSATYDLQMRKCITAHLGAAQAIAATAAHNRTMSTLSKVKLAADIASNAAGAVASCADSVGGDTKFGAASAVACTADGVQAAADSVSDGMQFAMDEAERNHELELMQIEAQTEERTCFIEAEMALVGTRTATLRIERANQEVASQLVALSNAKNDLRGALQEGHEALAAELDRTTPAISIEYWLNEKVELYGAAFRTARRAVYLGVLAVEYEYQLSTPERGNVLAATKVSELRAVLERLRNLVATGTVRGRAPADLHSVVSLRDNLLQLADQANLPAGWHQLSDVQRFQLLLTSPRFAVYGPTGTYLGQELPFRVAPLATLKLGETGGVALLSGQDCGERVWSVNAALQGDGVVTGDSTRARVTLKKRNRFFSQWCSPAPDPSTWQLSATRPSRNLFLDPFQDYLPGRPGSMPNPAATVDEAAEADAFTAARLQPVLNITRNEFETDQYFNGSSRELAGRGLYGDYALFFPAEVLSRGGSDGLRLDHLSDVLLRFDYVSVAQR